jgi:hypothetical protein
MLRVMANITMTREQYEALCTLAKAADQPSAFSLQRTIDTANGVRRFFLNVRWQNVGGQPPTRIELGKGWPVDQTYQLELERPISRHDVDDILRINAINPVSVMVTPDRYGIVGWSLLNDYEFPAGG